MSSIGGGGVVLLLSSSPPRIFARSPTPANDEIAASSSSSSSPSSPALPSPRTIFASSQKCLPGSQQGARRVARPPAASAALWDGRRPRDENTRGIVVREGEGFGLGSCSSTTTKEEKKNKKQLPLLREIPNKENVPIVRRAEAGRLHAGLESDGEKQKQKQHRQVQGPLSPTHRYSEQGRDEHNDDQNTNINDAGVTLLQDDTTAPLGTPELTRSRKLSPLHIDKAPARRLDWTPPGSCIGQGVSLPAPVSFSQTLLGSFGYNADLQGSAGVHDSMARGDVNPTKRRKLEVVENGTLAPASVASLHRNNNKASKSTDERTRKREKSPKKRYTTITGLAASHYLGRETSEASPMMQYLSATQRRALDQDSDPVLDGRKREGAARKARGVKKASCKSALRSPQSAIKACEGQEMLFGSASQLARDESPTSIRDTVQAIKHSEDTFMVSDPMSTQITVPTSEPAETPKARDRRGISRFVKTRNLWSAADRDDDNALLQVDTLDMLDSPDVRKAFAGKDVLLEPGPSRFGVRVDPDKQILGQPNALSMHPDRSEWPSARLAEVPRLYLATGAIDVDGLGIGTPYMARPPKSPSQVRAIHTAALADVRGSKAHKAGKDSQTVRPQPVSHPRPTKPSYNGFTTSQLASQLSAYGFKPIKKREKMIEMLDKCWDNKHNLNTNLNTNLDADRGASRSKAVKRSHSDFLTKVHDISTRPTAKVKKPKGRPRKDDAPSDGGRATKKTPAKKSAGEVLTAEGEGEEETAGKKTRKGCRAVQSRGRKGKDDASTSRPKGGILAHVKTKRRPRSEEYVIDVEDIADDDDDDEHQHEHEQHRVDDGAEDQTDNTGVKPAERGRPRSLLPPIPPSSSDAFETASWLRAGTASKATKPEPDPGRTSSMSTPEPAGADSTAPSISPSPFAAAAAAAAATATTTTTAPPIITTPTPSPSTTTIIDNDATTTTIPPSLSSQITLAITTTTTTTTSQHPSPHNNTTNSYNSTPHQPSPTFHEKILMYDPIVLEDLAAWLNTVGFKAIAEDREVGPLELRDWCHQHGVCCLWKGGGWGKRGGGKSE